MLAHLAALEFHLGGPRSSPHNSQFGLLSGGTFVLHFGLPGSHFDPPWLHFEALLGSLGALPITFASTHILSQRCSEAHADKTMYDMIKPRPGGVRGSVINIWTHMAIYITKNVWTYMSIYEHI